MATNEWLGTATSVAQVDTFTPATVEINDIFTLTATGFDGTSDSISYTAVAATAADVAAALVIAWNAATGSLFTGITASGTVTVILTSDTAGTAFKVASSTTDGGGAGTQTFARVATTANGGVNDWQDATNWSLGTVPGEDTGGDNTEDVYIRDSAVDILYGLDNTGSTYYIKSLHADMTYTGVIGHNEEAGYEGDYLEIETALLYIGEDFCNTNSAGSSRLKIDIGAYDQKCIVTVYNTSTSNDTGKPAFRLKANNSLHEIRDIRKGTVGICCLPSETGKVASIFQSWTTSRGSDSTLSIGQGLTVTTIEALGGISYIKQASGKTITTLTSEGGTMLTLGAGAITTLNTDGGSVTPSSTGVITACNVKSGTCDFTQSAEPRTVTTLKVDEGATLKIDEDVVTLTNNIQAYDGGRLQYRISAV